MILGFTPTDLDTQHGSFYRGVDIRRIQNIQIVPKIRPHAIVAYDSQQVVKLVSEQTRLIIWMDPELDEDSRWDVSQISGRKMVLPELRDYSGVSVESYTNMWGLSQLERRGIYTFLRPSLPDRGSAYIFSVPENFTLTQLQDRKIRGEVLGHLGFPHDIRISPGGHVAINPTK